MFISNLNVIFSSRKQRKYFLRNVDNMCIKENNLFRQIN